MNSLINPYTVVGTFALLMLALTVFKPHAARIVLGIFFLVMALGVNLTVTLTDPTLYVAAGSHALLPLYRWFFTTVLAWNPALFAALLILLEMAIGALILSKGRLARTGLLLALAFCIGITPVGIEEITAPILALTPLLLLRRPFERTKLQA